MPPKVLRRPAAEAGEVRRRGLRRPAQAGEEAVADPRSEWQNGREVYAHLLPADLLASEVKLLVTKGTYWEEETKVAGIIKGLQVSGGAPLYRCRFEGLQARAWLNGKARIATRCWTFTCVRRSADS